MKSRTLLPFGFLFCFIPATQAQSMAGAPDDRAATYIIRADSIKAHVEPTMYGIFFEDINMAADGGVYAELVKNRSFEFTPNLMGWSEWVKDGGSGSVEVIDRSAERPENPHVITLTVHSGTGYYGLSNEGFRGMGIKKGETYHFSVLARQHPGSRIGLTVELVDSQGVVIGRGALRPAGLHWEKDTVSFVASATVEKAHLDLWAHKAGAIDLDMVSLFPEHTWRNRPGGYVQTWCSGWRI